MGLLMAFHAGEAHEIGAAVHARDYEGLRSVGMAHADFSLHLSPIDLDLLSRERFR